MKDITTGLMYKALLVGPQGEACINFKVTKGIKNKRKWEKERKGRARQGEALPEAK